MDLEVKSAGEMMDLGARIGAFCSGGEVFELIGDVGAGKTIFAKGFARGMGIVDAVQSPTFTINRAYTAPNGLLLNHYDFYRLSNPGVISVGIAESTRDSHTVTLIEWSDIVRNSLPEDRLQIRISSTASDSRQVDIKALGANAKHLLEKLA